MKSITKTTIAAIALIGVSTSANAACPNGEFEFFTEGLADDGVTPIAVQNCRTTDDKGGDVAWTGNPAKHLTPVLVDHDSDPLTPDVPLVIDGKQIVTGEPGNGRRHHHKEPKVYGINGIAIGDGAKVGYYVHASDGGTPDDPSDDTEAHFVYVNDGTAIGANAKVKHDNSTAIGSGSQSTDDHQVTLGTKDETIRAEGIASAKSKARQQGPVEVVTSDSGGRLATDGGEIFSRLGSLEGANAQQWNQIEDNTSRINTFGVRLEDAEKSIAIATAMPDAWLSDSKRFGAFASVGGTGNETAIGFAAIGRVDETWSINGKLGTDVEFEQLGWQVGASAQW